MNKPTPLTTTSSVRLTHRLGLTYTEGHDDIDHNPSA